jgi:TonB family protein
MRIRRFVVAALAAALLASIGTGGAVAFTTSIAVSRDKTTVLERSDATKPTTYAGVIRQIILTEVKATHVPFEIASPFAFILRFELNRRGQLLDVKLLQGSNSDEANEYAVMIIRRAAANFPPPPSSLGGERPSFAISIAMT